MCCEARKDRDASDWKNGCFFDECTLKLRSDGISEGSAPQENFMTSSSTEICPMKGPLSLIKASDH